MDFTLRQLEALLAVGRKGSLSAAADELEISQVAASGLIKGLERGLNLQLLLRKRGAKAGLSPEGELVIPHAEEVVEAAERLRSTSERLNASVSVREMRVGARPYLIDRWLRDMIARFQRDRPSYDVRLIRSSNEEIFAALADRDLAMGIFMHDEGLPSSSCRKLGAWPASLYVSANHPLAREGEIDADKINAHGFIGPPKGTSAERSIRKRLHRAGLETVRIVARAEYTEALNLMTIAGVGIGILLDNDARIQVELGKLVRLPLHLEPVNIWLAIARDSQQNEKDLAEFIYQQFEEICPKPSSGDVDRLVHPQTN
jgi:DNA-binding transcriptional LysR family regulator